MGVASGGSIYRIYNAQKVFSTRVTSSLKFKGQPTQLTITVGATSIALYHSSNIRPLFVAY